MRYLRFHGLLHDEMFVCRRENGTLIFNWQYVDDLIDALLEQGVRPFMEFGFFPKDLAGESDFRCFWWQAHVTPPEHYGEWALLIEKLVRHFIQRYGSHEVRQWYFEVWNEPNLWFFFNSTRSKYFELYRATVTAVKSVDGNLRVGGPATSNFVPDDRFAGEQQAGERSITSHIKDLSAVEWRGVWIREFLEFCDQERLPVDFISAHPYPTDIPFGHDVDGMRTRPVDSTVRDLQWLRDVVTKAPFPRPKFILPNGAPARRREISLMIFPNLPPISLRQILRLLDWSILWRIGPLPMWSRNTAPVTLLSTEASDSSITKASSNQLSTPIAF